MSDYILNEAASKSKKRYKCPYCGKHDTKDNLVSHIEKFHEDMIPQGYSANRVLFNYINKKEYGTCVCGCGRKTEWNETTCRYNRLSSDPKCKERYIEQVNARKAAKYGTWNLAADPEFQEKMLAGRKISGTYNFKGTKFTYTGKYEKNVLEFLDKVMDYSPRDIMCPGPIIPYEYNGQQLHYISDMMIIPYNLIIEIKDGGDNPNNRPMESYREKQLAKEKRIKEDGEFNYVRVTNNQFEQLLEVLAELKLQLIDDTYEKGNKIFRVNEAMEPMNCKDTPVLVHYQNNITLEEGLYVAKDILLQEVYIGDDIEGGPEALRDCSYSLYYPKIDVDMSLFKNKVYDSQSIYKVFTGNDLYSFSQIALDPALDKATDVWEEIENTEYITMSNLLGDGMSNLDRLQEELDEVKGGL
jgi:hypothetical protein